MMHLQTTKILHWQAANEKALEKIKPLKSNYHTSSNILHKMAHFYKSKFVSLQETDTALLEH